MSYPKMKILQFRRYMYSFLEQFPMYQMYYMTIIKCGCTRELYTLRSFISKQENTYTLKNYMFLHNYVSIDIFILETKVLGEQFGQNDAQV